MARTQVWGPGQQRQVGKIVRLAQICACATVDQGAAGSQLARNNGGICLPFRHFTVFHSSHLPHHLTPAFYESRKKLRINAFHLPFMHQRSCMLSFAGSSKPGPAALADSSAVKPAADRPAGTTQCPPFPMVCDSCCCGTPVQRECTTLSSKHKNLRAATPTAPTTYRNSWLWVYKVRALQWTYVTEQTVPPQCTHSAF